MDFQVKKSEIGGNHISRWKKTINQVPLMSLDDKVATERKKKTFLDAAKKQARYSVCVSRLKSSKEALKYVNFGQNVEPKVGMMFFYVKIKQERCRSYNYKLNWKEQRK